MICPVCSEDVDARKVENIASQPTRVTLNCGHQGIVNSFMGRGLKYETKDVRDPNTKVLEKRSVATEIDERELVAIDDPDVWALFRLDPEPVEAEQVSNSIVK